MMMLMTQHNDINTINNDKCSNDNTNADANVNNYDMNINNNSNDNIYI